jgi:endonuclease-8
MPEGDTIFIAATQLRKALLGRIVTGFDSTVPGVLKTAARAPLVGRVVSAVETRGKHLLITFTDPKAGPGTEDDALVLHTHMRMTGSWHIYRPAEAWRKPAHRAVVVIRTDAFVCPCFSAPVVELLTSRQTVHHAALASLGPDAIQDDFDPAEALRRLRQRADLPIGVALLDQRAFAGIGNVYKSEVLFCQRRSPFARVCDLSEAALAGIVDQCHRMLQLNREHGNRRTHFALDERERLWVYGRSGEPCRVCGEMIRMQRQGLDGRSTYYCPRCQA